MEKLELLKLASKVVKAMSLTATGSAVMSGANPWITLLILCIGAGADAILSYLKEKENAKV